MLRREGRSKLAADARLSRRSRKALYARRALRGFDRQMPAFLAGISALWAYLPFFGLQNGGKSTTIIAAYSSKAGFYHAARILPFPPRVSARQRGLRHRHRQCLALSLCHRQIRRRTLCPPVSGLPAGCLLYTSGWMPPCAISARTSTSSSLRTCSRS